MKVVRKVTQEGVLSYRVNGDPWSDSFDYMPATKAIRWLKKNGYIVEMLTKPRVEKWGRNGDVRHVIAVAHKYFDD